MPWKPIIQRKLSWSKNVMKHCSVNNTEIKEVWNVGFLDYNKGKYNNKILQECSIEEAIKEGLMQIKENEYVKDLFKQMGVTFDDIYMGCEHWYQFQNDSNGKLINGLEMGFLPPVCFKFIILYFLSLIFIYI